MKKTVTYICGTIVFVGIFLHRLSQPLPNWMIFWPMSGTIMMCNTSVMMHSQELLKKNWLCSMFGSKNNIKSVTLKTLYIWIQTPLSQSFLNCHSDKLKGKVAEFYCSVGIRSSKMLSDLKDQLPSAGVSQSYNLDGGTFKWHNDQIALISNEQSTNDIHPYNAFWGVCSTISQRSNIHTNVGWFRHCYLVCWIWWMAFPVATSTILMG